MYHWCKEENNVLNFAHFIQSAELIIYKIQSAEYGKLVKERIQKRIPNSSWSLILAIVIRKIQDTDPNFTVTNPWL